jgi:predicted NBD/HSP70 family sugar kinase
MANEAAERGEFSHPIQNVHELLTLAQTGNPTAIAIFARAGGILGQGIANLINLFNPQKIIISGEGARAGSLLFDPMRVSVRQNTMPGLVESTTIQIDPWGDDAWARGAAGLVLRELFESPVYRETITTG